MVITEEISKQLIDSDAKLLFGDASMQQQLEAAVKLSKKQIKIVYLKSTQDASVSGGGILFNELIDISGNFWNETEWIF